MAVHFNRTVMLVKVAIDCYGEREDDIQAAIVSACESIPGVVEVWYDWARVDADGMHCINVPWRPRESDCELLEAQFKTDSSPKRAWENKQQEQVDADYVANDVFYALKEIISCFNDGVFQCSSFDKVRFRNVQYLAETAYENFRNGQLLDNGGDPIDDNVGDS